MMKLQAPRVAKGTWHEAWRWGACVAVLALAWPALAHDGHADEAPPVMPTMTAPRITLQTDLFELVGVLQGHDMALYLDHAADNRPVKDARLELEVAGQTVQAERVADGQYRAALEADLPPGVTPMTATVWAGEDTDLMAGEWNLSAPPEPVPLRSARLWWMVGVGSVVVAMVVWWAVRRRTRTGPTAQVQGGTV